MEDGGNKTYRDYTFYEQLQGLEPLAVIKQSKACQKCASNGKSSCYCYLTKCIFQKINPHQKYHPQVETEATQLHETKCRLNDFNLLQWSEHTDTQFPASRVKPSIRNTLGRQTDENLPDEEEAEPPEMLTNSWLKIYELMVRFSVPESADSTRLNTLHLAECPGGFIAATNHYIETVIRQNPDHAKLIWRWKANTLDAWHEHNDWHEMLDNNLFLKETYGHWIKGIDGTGNIKRTNNFNSMLSELAQTFKCDLITADGSFDTQHDAERQEELLFSLLLSEILMALAVLRTGGSFIIKMYGLLTPVSIGLLGLIANCFSETHVTKPFLSKAGNSEVYVVAKKFIGVSSTLFDQLRRYIESPVSDGTILIPDEFLSSRFLREWQRITSKLANRQRETIETNIKSFEDGVNLFSANEKQDLASEWINDHDIRPITKEAKIIPSTLLLNKSVNGNDLHEQRLGQRLDVPSTFEKRQIQRHHWTELQNRRVEPFKNGNGGDLVVGLDVDNLKKSCLGCLRDVLMEEFKQESSNKKTDMYVFSQDKENEKELAEKIVEMVLHNSSEDRFKYGRWIEDGSILKPFKIVSSPFFSQDYFRKLLKVRCCLPQWVPPVTYADAGLHLYSTSDKMVIHPMSIDIALLLLTRYRHTESQRPSWLAICSHMDPRDPSNTVDTLSLRRTGCKGLTVDLMANDPKPDDPFFVPGQGLRQWNEFKGFIETKIKSPGGVLEEATDGFKLVIVDVCTVLQRIEPAQNEIDDQKRLLRALRGALKFLADKGDLILVLGSVTTRFTGSLLLLLASAFKDSAIWRPPTVSAWTQKRYVYFRRFINKGHSDSLPSSAVRATMNFCATKLNDRSMNDPKNIKSFHFVLPPVMFSSPAASEWIQTANDSLFPSELKDLEGVLQCWEYVHTKLTDDNSCLKEPQTWIKEYENAIEARFSHLQEKILDLFHLRELFLESNNSSKEPSLIEWIRRGSSRETDWETFSSLPLSEVGLRNDDWEEGAMFDAPIGDLQQSKHYLNWGFDFAELIKTEEYKTEHDYFFETGHTSSRDGDIM